MIQRFSILWNIIIKDKLVVAFVPKRPAITKHLSNIFEVKELSFKSVCSILEHTVTDGKNYKTKFYNLDAIISVGYRVNSAKATHFRIWATNVLRKHLVDGYTVNEKRLVKNSAKYAELQKTIALIKNIKSLADLSTEAIRITVLLMVIRGSLLLYLFAF
ncbi:MAG: RhuM family protein [Candidatus Omnitrophica bacterium]|nr:RhuM family protein [Candidatus Omnitrophota bacterium]